MQAMAKMENDKTKADADMLRAQTDAQSKQAATEIQMARVQMDMQKLQDELGLSAGSLDEKRRDRMAKERIQLIDLAQNLAVHPESVPLVAPLVEPVLREMGIVSGTPEGGQQS
jgi:hypothetical protein